MSTGAPPSARLRAHDGPRFLGRPPRAWSEPLAAGPRVAFVVIIGSALLAASAAVLEQRPLLTVAGIVAFGLGFGIVVASTRRQRGPIGVVALGSALGGLFAGITIGGLTLLFGPPGRGALTFLLLLAPAIAATAFAPICAFAFAPVLIAATRAIRAPSHDGPVVVLAIAGGWGALVAGVVGLFVGTSNPRAWLVIVVIGAGLALTMLASWWRGRMAAELDRVRRGEIAGLSLVSDPGANGLDGEGGALPLLRGAEPREPACLVSEAAASEYREAPKRTVLARVDANGAAAPGLLEAAFAGARPAGWEVLVLAGWTAAIALIVELMVFSSHR